MDFETKCKIQYGFNKILLNDLGYDIDNLSPYDLNNLLVILTTHITGECYEVLQELNWKMHNKKVIHTINKEKILEELIDIDKFLHTFLVYLQVSEKDFTDMWLKKSHEVFSKYLKSKEKIIGEIC